MNSTSLSRRVFIKICAAGGAAALLTACGSSKRRKIVTSVTHQATMPSTKVSESVTAQFQPNAQSTTKQSPIISTNNILTIGLGWQENWVRNFNPFYYQSVYYPRNCIYEPLMVYNSRTGELIPWLASGYQWGVGNQTLTFTLRKGIKWSDGESFELEDVVATFQMLMNHPDINGMPGYLNPLSEWLRTYLAGISTPDAFTVKFRFQNVNTLALYKLATAVILPKHIWGQLARPQDFTNIDPVGTGPFTEVTVFDDRQAGFERILQLERNPYYWQEGKPYIQAVRFSFRHEENTMVDLTQGKLDWTSITIPDIQKDFIDVDPSHYQVTIDTSGSMNLLQLNTIHSPFDNPEVRKAISMGIDRQRIVEAILPGYLEPANVVGLGDRYKLWWNEEAIRAGSWGSANAFNANAILDELGFTKKEGGTRVTPDGKRMAYKLIIDPGYPDQDAAARIISLGLADLGILVSVTPTDNWWDAFTTDDYDMALFADGFGFSNTPDEFFLGLMSPSGTPIPGAKTNLEAGRYNNPEAGILLDQFTHESNPLRQKAIIDEIQMIFVKDAPSIPLYPNFWLIEYNTTRFTGFPSDDDPYAEGNPGDILVILNVRPR
jgi:peptide/nickel transport system substrate-binding protein